MEANRGGFDQYGSSPHDRRFNAVRQESEIVTSAGFGALLLAGMRPAKGKIFVTTLRLAAVLDDPGMPTAWSVPWRDIANVRLKKGLMGATAFVTTGGREIGVDSTKAIVGDVERAWLHLRSVTPVLEHCAAVFPPDIDVRCTGCRSQLPPGIPACSACLRVIDWPVPLAELSAAMANPDSLLPSQFPDGSTTQREPLIPGLAVLVAAAMCLGEVDFVNRVAELVAAIHARRNANPSDFGTLPALRGAGDQRANEAFWAMATSVPSKLSPR